MTVGDRIHPRSIHQCRLDAAKRNPTSSRFKTCDLSSDIAHKHTFIMSCARGDRHQDRTFNL
ncbi:MAG: hypothetical protein KAF91_05120 [Nostoc sp. TH1S01]|nr:hypothetical protein [Nostoc sp. TH1S01]